MASERKVRWWHRQQVVCWHPESPGVRVVVWRRWWKRRPFASLRELGLYYRPMMNATEEADRAR